MGHFAKLSITNCISQENMLGGPREPWKDGPDRVCWELPNKPTEVGPGRIYLMGAFREPHEVGPDRV
jgi:hypothetical protein